MRRHVDPRRAQLRWRILSTLIGAACSWMAVGEAAAQAATSKEQVLRADQVTPERLVEALDPGTPQATDGLRTRGFRPAGAAPPRPAGTAASGKAPLLITFRTGSHELTAESAAVVAKVADALRSDRLAGFMFQVEGHADPRGDDQVNVRLSRARAAAVVQELVGKHGIAPERLSAVGKGSMELVDAARPQAPENRRVTFVTQRR